MGANAMRCDAGVLDGKIGRGNDGAVARRMMKWLTM